jgi:hypothetical protein
MKQEQIRPEKINTPNDILVITWPKKPWQQVLREKPHIISWQGDKGILGVPVLTTRTRNGDRKWYLGTNHNDLKPSSTLEMDTDYCYPAPVLDLITQLSQQTLEAIEDILDNGGKVGFDITTLPLEKKQYLVAKPSIQQRCREKTDYDVTAYCPQDTSNEAVETIINVYEI